MVSSEREWVETDGLGGLAMGSSDGIRRRRYHALLQVGHGTPGRRFVLINGLDVHLVTPSGRFPLSSQCYSPGTISPDSRGCIVRFTGDPWPTWHLHSPDGTELIQEIMVPRGVGATVVTWRLLDSSGRAYLSVRPLLSGRDAHALHRENNEFDFEPSHDGDWLIWQPYRGVPGMVLGSSATYRHDPCWYRSFRYEQDLARGYDFEEDLASPGSLTFDLAKGSATLVCVATDDSGGFERALAQEIPSDLAGRWRAKEKARRTAPGIHGEFEDFLIDTKNGEAVLAGLPWFGEDLRSTAFLSRCLLRQTDGIERSARIVTRGLLARPDTEGSVIDGHFWMILAAHEVLEFASGRSGGLEVAESKEIRQLMADLLKDLAAPIEAAGEDGWITADGLLQVGPARSWMNGRVGESWVTPRSGKPVELQALWLNALKIGSLADSSWEPLFDRGLKAFRSRFWNRETGCLFDVVDGDGGDDPSIRPNQLLAIGGLPFPLLRRSRAAQVLDVVEEHLLTPAGLRSLDPRDLAYRGQCRGGEWERIAALHQGAVWPWLLGPFVEAWLRIYGRTELNLERARNRFLEPLRRYRGLGVYGHLAQLSDGNPPHPWRGSPAYALSDTVLIRLEQLLEGGAGA